MQRSPPGRRTGDERGKIPEVGVDRQRSFQVAFARLCCDAGLRHRFASDPREVGDELGLDTAALAVLAGIDGLALEAYADSIFERRWRSMVRTVPATARVWPQLRDRCRAHASHRPDADGTASSGAARRSLGLRALLEIRAPIDAELRRGDAVPPWLSDLFAFEIEHALAREEGLARDLECDWPAHQLAERCARGDVPRDLSRGSFRYRLVADQVFVRGS